MNCYSQQNHWIYEYDFFNSKLHVLTPETSSFAHFYKGSESPCSQNNASLYSKVHLRVACWFQPFTLIAICEINHA